MLKTRMQKAKRLLGVHQDLQRLEEEKIALLSARQAEIAAALEELVGTLNGEGELRDLLMPAVVRRLKALSEETPRVAAEIERRSQALREIASRTKHAERLSRSYEQEHDRVRAADELRDIIENIARPKDASLP